MSLSGVDQQFAGPQFAGYNLQHYKQIFGIHPVIYTQQKNYFLLKKFIIIFNLKSQCQCNMFYASKLLSYNLFNYK